MRGSTLPLGKAAVALVILGVSALSLGAYINARQLVLTKKPIHAPGDVKFSDMPRRFEGWARIGSDKLIEGEMLRELGTRNYLSRHYVETDPPEGQRPRRVSLHMAYYTGTIDTVPHVPERCMVGAGWEIVRAQQITPVPITFEADGVRELVRDTYVDPSYGTVWLKRDPKTGGRVRLPLGVEKLRMSVTNFRNAEDTVRLYAGYFFIANGVAYPTAEQVRLNAYRLENEYAYYAKVQFSSTDVSSAEELGELASDFLDASFHEIMPLLPDWVEVDAGRYPPEADNDGAMER